MSGVGPGVGICVCVEEVPSIQGRFEFGGRCHFYFGSGDSKKVPWEHREEPLGPERGCREEGLSRVEEQEGTSRQRQRSESVFRELQVADESPSAGKEVVDEVGAINRTS